jgi:recombination protein RecT
VTDLGAALELAAQTPEQKTIHDLIQRQRLGIEAALGRAMDADRFTRTVLTELRRTPKLYECNPESLLGAMMLAAQLQLEPGPLGLVYFVPFNRQVEFIVGYRGYVELAFRSKLVKDVSAALMYEGEPFEYRKGTRPFLDHEPREQEEGAFPVAAYAVARLKTGGAPFEVIYERDWERAKSRSAAGAKGSGPWVTDTLAMIRKTAVRRLEPQLPKTAAFARALEVDETPAEPFEEELPLPTEGDES